MMCRACKASFEPEEVGVVCDEYPYGEGVVEQVTNAVCPNCGADELVDEGCCMECGGEFEAAELQDGLCAVCREDLLQTLDWAWTMLSPAQKTWAAANTAWMEF